VYLESLIARAARACRAARSGVGDDRMSTKHNNASSCRPFADTKTRCRCLDPRICKGNPEREPRIALDGGSHGERLSNGHRGLERVSWQPGLHPRSTYENLLRGVDLACRCPCRRNETAVCQKKHNHRSFLPSTYGSVGHTMTRGRKEGRKEGSKAARKEGRSHAANGRRRGVVDGQTQLPLFLVRIGSNGRPKASALTHHWRST
jgi:hypothetical protein